MESSSVRIRAFDFVDFFLYFAATIGFLTSTINVLWSEPKEFSRIIYAFGIIPNLTDGDTNANPTLTFAGGLFIAFVVLVYCRNYIIMHRIDNRREENIWVYSFINYNGIFYHHLERTFRAAIVLWVLISTVGLIPYLTDIIAKLIINLWLLSNPASELNEVGFQEPIFTYYGFVIFVLFILFIFWDLINIASISRVMKNNINTPVSIGQLPTDEDELESRHVPARQRHAIPRQFNNSEAVCSIIAYIQPLSRFFEGSDGRTISEKLVSANNLLGVYVLSKKFLERLIGVAIGTMMFFTIWWHDDYSHVQPILITAMLSIYISLLGYGSLKSVFSFFLFPLRYYRFPVRDIGQNGKSAVSKSSAQDEPKGSPP